MKFANRPGAIVAISGAGLLWASVRWRAFYAPTLFVVAACLVALLFIVFAVWLRNRRRRQLMDMRDSALW